MAGLGYLSGYRAGFSASSSDVGRSSDVLGVLTRMPARVVVVLSDARVCDETANALSQAGYGALPLPSFLSALGALESARRELLIVGADLGPGEPSGIALVRMARMKRPDTKVLFIGERSQEHHMEGLGVFLVAPADAPQIARRAIKILLTAA